MTARALVLSYDRSGWRARGHGVNVTHVELRGLEELIEAHFASEHAVDVQLAFDPAALPAWLHQYQSHYCNYVLRVPARGGDA